MTKTFAFYGRVSTEDHQDPEASRAWQKARAVAAIDGKGEIVEEYFDVGTSRSLPWPRRQQAARLLEDAQDPDRKWDAIVVGDHTRAFSGDQFASTLPLLAHHNVRLWVPDLGEVDPDNVSHEVLMAINGLLSKNERAAMRIRVKEAMKAQVESGIRHYMGGRPPYGYALEPVGPHPNPEKAALGKMLYRLEPNDDTAPIVTRIFSEFADGAALRRLAQDLTDEGVPSPSGSDRARNSHRHGLAWSHAATRAILSNPVYLGHMVHGRTRKRDVLIDPHNPSSGYRVERTRVPEGEWSWSPEPTHEALVDQETWNRVKARLTRSKGTTEAPAQRKPRTTSSPSRVYVLSGHLHCGVCGRRLQGQTNRSRTLYRCRYRDQYATSDSHPKNIYVAEGSVLPGLHEWLGELFAPDLAAETAARLIEEAVGADPMIDERRRLEAVERKARADLDHLIEVVKAGGNAKVLAAEINAAKGRLDDAADALQRLQSQRPHTLDAAAIEETIRRLGASLLDNLDPLGLREAFVEMGLRLTYDPDAATVTGEIDLSASTRWGYVRVGGGT